MAEQILEGTWEEIVAHAPELRGRRLQVRILDRKEAVTPPAAPNISLDNQRILAVLEEWQRTPLTDAEMRVVDDFEQFRKDHPFRLRRLDLEEAEG